MEPIDVATARVDAAQLVLDLRAELAESPVWHPGRHTLYFVDILQRTLYEYDPTAEGPGLTRFAAPESVGCVAPAGERDLVVALASGIATFSPDLARFGPIVAPPQHDPRRCRFNDGKCDPQGRFWAGTMSLTGEALAGALYCFSPGQKPRQVLANVSVSNGLAWSNDSRTLYYIDSRTRCVDAFTFDPATGQLSNRRAAITFPPDRDLPDGCTIDAEGMLWVAHWNGGCVTRWNPGTGQLLTRVEVPAPRVTSCAFGGPDHEVLYITTARQGLSPSELAGFPLSGGIFSYRPDAPGLSANRYQG